MRISDYVSVYQLGDVVLYNKDLAVVHGIVIDPGSRVAEYYLHTFDGRMVPGLIGGAQIVPVP